MGAFSLIVVIILLNRPIMLNMNRCFKKLASRAQQNLASRTLQIQQKQLASQMTIRDALNSAIDEEIKRDKNVFLLAKRSLNTTEPTRSPKICTKHGETNEL